MKQRIIPVRFEDLDLKTIDTLRDKTGARSRSEFIREAVRHYLDTVGQMRIIRIRNIS